MASPAVGSIAPNFDLRSTEDVILMLIDEAPRAAQVLYFFDDPANESRRAELAEISRHAAQIKAAGGGILAISPAKIDDLKAVQRELDLAFPLLRDDRGFSAAYGVETPEEGDATPAMFVVDRDCKVLWSSHSVSVSSAMAEVIPQLGGLPSPMAAYPKSVINRLVERFAGGA